MDFNWGVTSFFNFVLIMGTKYYGMVKYCSETSTLGM